MRPTFFGTAWQNTRWRKCYSRLKRIGLAGRTHGLLSAKLTVGDFSE